MMEGSFQKADFIISKRNWLFCTGVFVGFVIAAAIAINILLTYFTLIATGKEIASDRNSSYFFAVAFGAAAIVSLVQYLIHSRPVRITEEQLSIGRKIIRWSDVETITLNGGNRTWFNYKGDAIILHLRNGKTKYLYDAVYSNTPQLKSFIARNILHQQGVSLIAGAVQKVNLDGEQFSVFSGHQLLSLRGAMMWLLVSFFLYLSLFVKLERPYGHILFFGVAVFFLTMFSQSMYYFKVSTRFLMVRRQNLFLVQKTYLLLDIEEAIIEEDGAKLRYLRIVTKDFQSKKYPAATLWDDAWMKLQEKLDEYGVNVRNDFRDTNPIY